MFVLLYLTYPPFTTAVKLNYYRATGKDDAIFQNYYNARSNGANSTEMATTYDQSISQRGGTTTPNDIHSDKIIVTKTNTKIGPATMLCPEDSSYYPSFMDEQNYEHAYYQNFAKAVTTDGDGNMIELYLTNNEGTYEYRGGEYAVLREHSPDMWDTPLEGETVQVVPATDSGLPTEAIYGNGDYLISDQNTAPVDLVEPEPYHYSLNSIETINGKDYLVYESQYTYYCYIPENQEPIMYPAIQKTWIDPDTYGMTKDILYFNTVSNETMVHETTTQTNYIDSSEQNGFFEFNIDTDIRIITYRSEEDILFGWLESEDTHLLVPSDNDYWSISTIYSSKAYDALYMEQDRHYTDRSFYSANAIGEYYFNYMNASDSSTTQEAMLLPERMDFFMSDLEVNATSATDNISLYSATYNGTINEASFTEQLGLTEGHENGQATLLINTTPVASNWYSPNYDMTYEREGIELSTDGEGNSTEPFLVEPYNTYDNRYYIFTYEGNTYVITISGDRDTLTSLLTKTLAFTLLSTQNPQDLERIKQLYTQTQTYPQPMPMPHIDEAQ